MNAAPEKFLDLEVEIHGFSSMVGIMADMLDDALTIHAIKTADGRVLLTDDQLDDLAFAQDDVVRWANALKQRFLQVANVKVDGL